MTEEFLYYIWKYRLFDIKCKTEEGQNVEVIKIGESNRDAGPDFINAKIRIGNTVWAGNVEVHLNSSDWYKHKHDKDKAYKNVILHVVYNYDKIVYRREAEIIPTLVLKERFDEKLFENYKQIVESKNKIPCQKLLGKVDEIVMTGWKETLLIERLERKVKTIEEILIRNGNNWEQTFYQHLARNFGFKLNADAFEMLARATPYECIAKHKDNLFQIETILFGQAGLLDKVKTLHAMSLQKEYKYLKHKLSLKPIEGHLWKFLRLRPANFPTIRIAQFAYLLGNNDNLFSKVMEAKRISDIEKIFKVKTSEYWETHYVFDKQTKRRTKVLGKISVNNLIINTVIPFVFLYGIKKDNFAHKEKAMKFLELIPAERNSITDMWAGCGVKATSVFDSQALIELRNEYCTKTRCLECRLGHAILNYEL